MQHHVVSHTDFTDSKEGSRDINTPLQLSGLNLDFKLSLDWIASYEISDRGAHIQNSNFSLTAKFHNLSVSDFNSMTTKNLKMYKGFNREK